jgi:tetratricopeptide (TPR) repeat protein
MSDAAFEQSRTCGIQRMRVGAFAEAAAHFEDAETLASTAADRALAQIHMASVCVLQGTPSRRIDELPVLLMRHDSPRHVYLASYYLALHFAEERRTDAAARYLTLLFDAAEAMDDSYYRAGAYDVGCNVARSAGDLAMEYEYALRANETIAACAPTDDAVMARAAIGHNLGYALLAGGHYENAVDPLRRGADALDACGAGAIAVQAYINLAFAHFAVGDHEESEQHLQVVEERIVPTTEWLRKYVYFLRGEIAQRRGRYGEARSEYRRLCEHYPAFANLVELLSGVSLFPLLLPERT